VGTIAQGGLQTEFAGPEATMSNEEHLAILERGRWSWNIGELVKLLREELVGESEAKAKGLEMTEPH
jgi:hypothetical protein